MLLLLQPHVFSRDLAFVTLCVAYNAPRYRNTDHLALEPAVALLLSTGARAYVDLVRAAVAPLCSWFAEVHNGPHASKRRHMSFL